MNNIHSLLSAIYVLTSSTILAFCLTGEPSRDIECRKAKTTSPNDIEMEKNMHSNHI